MSKEIPLTKGMVAIVDDADYEWLSQWKWSYDGSKYAHRTIRKNNRQQKVRMHRLIMDAPQGMEVDHINQNKLDNRRCNLRLATHAQNKQNRPPRVGYKGVHYVPREKAWLVQISANGKKRHVGIFRNEIEAAHAYDKAAKELHGEFAYLNFPDQPAA